MFKEKPTIQGMQALMKQFLNVKKHKDCVVYGKGCSKYTRLGFAVVDAMLAYAAFKMGKKFIQFYKSKQDNPKQDQEVEAIAKTYNINTDNAAIVLQYFKNKYGSKWEKKLQKDKENYGTFLQDSLTPRNIDMYNALSGSELYPEGGYYYIKYPGKLPDIINLRDPYGHWEAKEAIKPVVDVYKIHLMPKIDNINKVVALVARDSNIVDKSSGIKVKTRLNGVMDKRLPIIVIYITTGKKIAQEVLNSLCRLLRGIKGNGIISRYNKQVNSLINFAQGSGDDKKIEKFAEYYTPDKVYYTKELNERGGNPDYELDYFACRGSE